MRRTYRQVLKELMTSLLDEYEATQDLDLVRQATCWEQLWDQLEEANRLDTPSHFEVTDDLKGIISTFSMRPYAVIHD